MLTTFVKSTNKVVWQGSKYSSVEASIKLFEIYCLFGFVSILDVNSYIGRHSIVPKKSSFACLKLQLICSLVPKRAEGRGKSWKIIQNSENTVGRS